VRDALGAARQDLCVQGGRRVFPPLARDLCVFVFVLGLARRATRLLDDIADHRHDGVVRHAPLARTIIIQNVTQPKLALLHKRSRDTAGGN
jgi:hypothetical protein